MVAAAVVSADEAVARVSLVDADEDVDGKESVAVLQVEVERDISEDYLWDIFSVGVSGCKSTLYNFFKNNKSKFRGCRICDYHYTSRYM